jgi:hypothetical protein
LSRITDLKVHPRGTQKNLLYKERILKEFFAGGKAKFAYFAGVKTYLPLNLLAKLLFYTTISFFRGARSALGITTLLSWPT